MAIPERLTDGGSVELRRWDLDRLDDLMAAIETSVEELQPWLPWVHPVPTRDEERDIVRRSVQRFDAGEDFSFFIIECATDEVVGCAGLHPRPDNILEIGYWVRSDRHRRGYATTAAGLLAAAATEHFTDARMVQIRTDQANAASAAIPPKIGFALHATRRWERELCPAESGIELVWVMRPTPG